MKEVKDISDMRFVINSVVQKQIEGKVNQTLSNFKSLLSYLSEDNKVNIEDIVASDKITMSIDKVVNEVLFTVYLMNNLNNVIGQAIVTYEFSKEETFESLFLYSLSDDFLSHLEYSRVQYGLCQSEKQSVDDLIYPGKIYNIELDGSRQTITGTNKQTFKIKFQVKCYIITEEDYKEEIEGPEEESE